MLDRVGNPEDRFSRVAAQFILAISVIISEQFHASSITSGPGLTIDLNLSCPAVSQTCNFTL